jgi:hypothetical protein
MSEELVTKRLHVAGLTPTITPAHIKDRFTSFGTVTDVEALEPDALGMSSLPYLYYADLDDRE